ncbi:hypothetical protein [Paraliomyxa miuraensis]|uniref:hypothetical protein n=1 Tax=Paraliomyxa miuraensis TaxID=376150 RepID=UPI00225AEF70|nr:hypothetical protein [Paraliomyxa miuraensis]MCX4245262.1 hypothetical protein [Paraliomyxa miuraensis]
MGLHFRHRPTPPFDEMPELLRAQLGPLLEQAESDGEDGESLIELLDVVDDAGQHIYDLHLFCGDDGQLHRTGTTEHVASFSQGFPTGTDDESLLEALCDAHARWNRSRAGD